MTQQQFLSSLLAGNLEKVPEAVRRSPGGDRWSVLRALTNPQQKEWQGAGPIKYSVSPAGAVWSSVGRWSIRLSGLLRVAPQSWRGGGLKSGLGCGRGPSHDTWRDPDQEAREQGEGSRRTLTGKSPERTATWAGECCRGQRTERHA